MTQAICVKCKMPVESQRDLVVASMGFRNPVCYHGKCYATETEGKMFSLRPTSPLNGPNYTLIKRFGIPVFSIMFVLDLLVLGFFAQYSMNLVLILGAMLLLPTASLFMYSRYVIKSVEKFENSLPEESP